MTSAGTPVPSPEGAALPTRRELRAREAAQKAAAEQGSVHVPVSTAAAATAPAIAAEATSASAAPAAPLRPLAKAAARPVRPAPVVRRSKSRNPVTVAVTLMAIPGLFLTAALPAYAFTPGNAAAHGASASRSLTTTEAQGITVAPGAATLTVARDGFTATSKEELAERDRQAKRAAAVAAAAEAAARSSRSSSSHAVRGERAEGDDYPWPYAATDNDGGGLSPLGYYYRECVDFVAWRLNRDAGSTGSPWQWKWGNLTPGAGSASSWKSQWERHGWTTSDTPVVGAVAWFTYNHVAYVQSVGDGTVVLEEYNWMGSHAYHTRTVSIDSVPKYLYPPA